MTMDTSSTFLNDHTEYGGLVGPDAFTGDELRGGQTDLGGQTSQVAGGGGTGQVADLFVLAGQYGGLPAF